VVFFESGGCDDEQEEILFGVLALESEPADPRLWMMKIEVTDRVGCAFFGGFHPSEIRRRT
jgi:hypothetical protein